MNEAMFVNVDTQLYGNPKIMSVSLESVGVYVLSLAFAADHLTNGVIPAPARKFIRAEIRHIRELEHAGLWVPITGGWVIHDYLDYQRSREQIEEDRERVRERVRKHRGRRNGHGL